MQADPNCEFCHGRGIVEDWVPYGSGNIPMPSQCDCVVEKCPYCASDDTECLDSNPDCTSETWHCHLCNNNFEVEV